MAVLESIIGTLAGGALRLAPEVMAIWDRKNERNHEMAMARFSLDAEVQKAKLAKEQTVVENEAKLSLADIDAMIQATKAQAAPSGVKWVDALSSFVRPFLTLWWAVVLYTSVLVSRFVVMWDAGTPAAEAIMMLWGPDEVAIVMTMIGFWFVDRHLSKRGHK